MVCCLLFCLLLVNEIECMKLIVWYYLRLCLYGYFDEMIDDVVIVVDEIGMIVWFGVLFVLLYGYVYWWCEDLYGVWVMLGFVDCYMYFVYGGMCVDEFV